jgi:hypothetical protein
MMHRPSRKRAWGAALLLALFLLAPLVVLLDRPARPWHPGGAWFALALGGTFCAAMIGLVAVSLRAAASSFIACGPDALTYRLPLLPGLERLRRPLAMRSGRIAYASIQAVHQRWEGRGSLRRFAVCLQTDGPRHTFARGLTRYDGWLEAFARDVAERANVELMDRGWVQWSSAAWTNPPSPRVRDRPHFTRPRRRCRGAAGGRLRGNVPIRQRRFRR